MAKAYELTGNSRYDSSISYYRRASALLEATTYKNLYLRSLNGIAHGHLRKAQCDSALRILDRALQVEENELGGRGLECAETHTLIGYAYSYNDRPDIAIEHLKKGLAIRRAELGENDASVAASYYMLGLALKKKGDFNNALGSLDDALRVQKSISPVDSIQIANTLIAIGNVCQSKSQYSQSIGYFLEALSLLAGPTGRGAYSQATCHFSLAQSQQESGDIAGAIGNYESALQLTRGLFGEDHQTVSTCYARLAQLYETSGDFGKAIDWCEKALSVMVKLNGENNSGTAAIYSMLGGIYGNAGELRRALDFSLKAMSIQKSTLGETHAEIGLAYERVANIYRKQHEYSRALEFYRDALRRRLRLGGSEDRVDIARIYRRMGLVYEETRQYNRAAEFLNKTLGVLNKATDSDRPLTAATYKALGDVHSEQHDFTRALSDYALAIKLLQAVPTDISPRPGPLSSAASDMKSLLDALTAEARTYERRYESAPHNIKDLQAALHDYVRAVDLIGQLRKTYEAERSKLVLDAEHFSAYDGGTRVSVRLLKSTGEERYKTAAFAFAEGSKANVLLDGIQEADSRHFAGIPDSVLAKERQLRTDITLCETQLVKEQDRDDRQDGAKVSALQNRRFALNQEYGHLVRLLETSYPKYYELKFRSRPTTIDAIQQSLDAQTCLLEYFIGERTLYIFTISGNSFDLVSLPKPVDFEKTTTAFCQSIKTVDQTSYLQSSPVLYRLLIHPIERHLAGKKRLVIIPDGILFHVPFEALAPIHPSDRRGATRRLDFTRLPYLVDAYEISYSYSSELYTLREREPDKGRSGSAGFVGFAPVFRDSTTSGYILASNVPPRADEISELRSFTVDGKRYRELPYSEEEVRSIAGDFAKRGNPSVGYFHADATKENFEREAGRYRYIHLATHGYMNEDHPGLSSLLFAPPLNETPPEDPALYAGDAYNLRLNADLLVLSSCESGVGRIVRGEGMMGITRGFLYSGARNIVYSLWKVFDRHAHELMSEFYTRLLDGESYSSSLRQAKLKMIGNPSTAFPTKWAGFVLIGE